jgi:hypothetical protein
VRIGIILIDVPVNGHDKDDGDDDDFSDSSSYVLKNVHIAFQS